MSDRKEVYRPGTAHEKVYVGPDEKAEKERAEREAREKHSNFTAGKAGAGAGGGADMPKQKPGEDMAAYSARLREWREKQRATPSKVALKERMQELKTKAKK